MSGPLVVIGDTLLDIDLHGRAGRLTPDAPVPVLDDLVERPRPGGAGLAARMAAAHGIEVVLVTALGADEAGDRVRGLLGGVDVRTLPYEGPTPVKERVRAGGQSLLRLDRGVGDGALGEPGPALAEVLADAAVVLVSDYGRGISALPQLRRWLAELSARVPIVWDPHVRGSDPVPGVRLATPNESEAAEFAARLGARRSGQPLARAGRHADALVEAWHAQSVAVTLGERGALLSYGAGAPAVLPAPAVTAVDTCGAGDRFAVSAALALASGAVTAEAVEVAVHDAARYVAAGGPASLVREARVPAQRPDSAEELARQVRARGGTVVATGGCFDLLHAGHVASLRAARGLGDCLVVCLNSDASVRRLKGPGRPLVPAPDRARVLEALEFVDAVLVFDDDTPADALRRLQPQVWAKGGDYACQDLPESAVLEEWGGQAVVLPYLDGRSTTRLVRTAALNETTSEEISR
ncbi:MAG TPA: PfkB family carbohydrate kinase [Marmoricola sp.]|nr:PfkB family carbohydrate kinase [Marmoricola sp.]